MDYSLVSLPQVAGVVGRADLLSALFCFLAFLCYAYAADDNMWVQYIQWKTFIFASRIILMFLSMLLVALALFSKEQGITIIVSIVVFKTTYKQRFI